MESIEHEHQEDVQYLLHIYGKGVWDFVFAQTKNRAVTDDLTQEVFIQAYLNWQKIRNKDSVKTWLFSVARHKCIDYFRSAFFRRIVLRNSLSPQGAAPSPEDEFMEFLSRNELSAAVLSLPRKYSEVVLLHIQHELNFREIGLITGVAEGTARTRYRRALIQLRSKLDKEMRLNAQQGDN